MPTIIHYGNKGKGPFYRWTLCPGKLILMFKTQFITLKINLVKHTPYTNDFQLGIALCMYMPNAYIFIIGWVVKQPTK